jgi:ABC-type multidrug transport system fused ATPase/permease subunit
VVMLAQGRVVDTGTVDELMARQPGFRAMWQSYAGGPDENAPEPPPPD